MIIYVFLNKVNKKVYIGQTIRPLKERISEHIKHAKKQRTYFQKALFKYGIEGFEVEILEICSSIEELNNKEIYYIDFFKATDINFGYNELPGGLNSKHSDITKSKISKANSGKTKPYMVERNHNYWTEEKRKEISNKRKGIRFCSDEQIDKMRKAKGHKILCLNTGNKYDSIKEAARDLKLHDSLIGSVLKKKYSHTGGYKFERV